MSRSAYVALAAFFLILVLLTMVLGFAVGADGTVTLGEKLVYAVPAFSFALAAAYCAKKTFTWRSLELIEHAPFGVFLFALSVFVMALALAGIVKTALR